MLDFKYQRDAKTGKEWIETSITGKLLLKTTQLNKDTAFTDEERLQFNLLGKLPAQVETLEQQTTRSYEQFKSYKGNLNKNIYLNNLHDRNQTLFYKLASDHLAEMLPAIYTPIVGTAVKQFSQEFRTARGLYLSYPERDHMEEILNNRSNPDIDLIVVTDGEGVLGIGDQGVGGMDIPIAKLMVYTLCGGINPSHTLPIQLDVGTNNEELLADPMYLGWRHKRLEGKEYDDFIDQFVSAVRKTFPNIFLHWEDFGRSNARRNLERFQDKVCTFNDDMQGTGVVTLSAILAAINAGDKSLKDQQIVVFGAGTAGTGIADQIRDAMVHEGLTREDANARFWLLDRPGLLCEDTPGLTDFQKPYAKDRTALGAKDGDINLLDVVKHVKPTILIGCSAVPGAFTEEVIKTMASHVKRPIVLPLSNPTERVEATPEDLYQWTDGKVLLAAGSPFDDIEYDGKTYRIAQCNNALVFPGIGLGLIAVNATKLTDEALWKACQALSEFAPITHDPYAPLLPPIDDAKEVANHIAKAVAQQVMDEGFAQIDPDTDLDEAIKTIQWKPAYLPYMLKK